MRKLVLRLPLWARMLVWRFWRNLPDTGDDASFEVQRAIDVGSRYGGLRIMVSQPTDAIEGRET